MGNIRLLMICGSAVFLMMGCSDQGDSNGSPDSPVSSGDPVTVEPNSAIIFDELKVADGFTFDMQRTVYIDISFMHKQGFTEISIYSAVDSNTNAPNNLLEKAEINNALKFTTSLPVPSYTESIIVVINGDSYSEIDLPIDTNNHIHYLVE